MKIANYLSAINLFVVLLMSFKNAHDTSLINTNKCAHNMVGNNRILGNIPSDNTEDSSNQVEGNADSSTDTSEENKSTSNQANADNASPAGSSTEPAKAGTTQDAPAQSDNTNGTGSNTADPKVILLSDDEEEEDDDDAELEDGDCSVDNGGCGENLICEKMENGRIKCSCPSGYKLHGTNCIALLSADSVNYSFCGIIMVAIAIIALLY
ncbi:merozoite surface protein 4/5, putative [Plasmodium chabaudi chabaudi]|uniref:Merozoite surface protein 4/5, putative n=1 Tax=Plasmodium chabaudi chabaudi TaxID=31271 RepID=A0A4V0K2E1_PLACU|nr:merozoite surface protein 4/5, putative [Plasmodium chabaudi chabaudi]VTZ66984.1 merozoite surface protein 4/5, putative [Plasmodium chabaudi chabaudi]|eukprot:XP_016653173.1 merozoite surface protein 4/5, putative [Plasmodium chabaudi chabaudi]